MTARRNHQIRKDRSLRTLNPNIPIEHLRTIVYVARLRSQTKAADALGVSQPTVSTHIKNLQEALGSEVFDKSVPGVRLTQIGEAILERAHAILELHDEFFKICSRSGTRRLVKIGIHTTLVEAMLQSALKQCGRNLPGIRFQVTTDTSQNLLAALQTGELDIALALTIVEPDVPSTHRWAIELVWASAPEFELDASSPVPLVTYSGNSQLAQIAKSALAQTGREFEVVYTSPSAVGLATAVANGLGVAVMTRDALAPGLNACSHCLLQQRSAAAREPLVPQIIVCSNGVLPKLPALIYGIYRRSVCDPVVYDEVAGAIAAAVTRAHAELPDALHN